MCNVLANILVGSLKLFSVPLVIFFSLSEGIVLVLLDGCVEQSMEYRRKRVVVL